MNQQACQLNSIQVERSGQTHTLAVGEKLHVNDRFAVTLQLGEWSYLYVARISLQGTRMLFPTAGAFLQAPGAQVRIPAAEDWIRCEELNQDEKLCLIVARQRLDEDAGNGNPRDGGQIGGSDEKTPDKRTGFEQMIEIPVSR